MKRILGLFAILLLLASAISRAQTQAPPNNPQCSDFTFNPTPIPALTQSANKQYFSYNGATLPLVGVSSEYLCHVAQPGTFVGKDENGNPVTVTPSNAYCTWDNNNYRRFIDRLAASGLNVLRVWVGMNQSVSRARGLTAPQAPYPSEQPFKFENGKWHLSQYDPTYFQRLQCVVAYAATKNVMVEVTLFDPWSKNPDVPQGDWTSGPWADANNHEDNTGFTAREYFASFESTNRNDPTLNNNNARLQQDALVRKVVRDLNPYPNIYWEIANEPDFGGIVTGTAAMQWQNRIAQIIQAEEVGKKTHLIGVNISTDSGLTALTDGTNPNAAQAKIVNGHYVSVESTATSLGAIELLRTKHGQAGFTDRVFGFNESKATPDPNIPSSARAEAWEFMVSEGGLYDNYNLLFRDNATTVNTLTNRVFNQLGILKGVLQGMDLENVRRDGFCGPISNCWIRNLRAYGSLDPAAVPCTDGSTWRGNTYWAAMHSPSVYMLYLHHSMNSSVNGVEFTRYLPPPAGCPKAGSEFKEQGLQFRPEQGGNYLVQWIEPATNTVKVTTTLTGLQAGSDYLLPTSHPFVYDAALKITKTQ